MVNKGVRHMAKESHAFGVRLAHLASALTQLPVNITRIGRLSDEIIQTS